MTPAKSFTTAKVVANASSLSREIAAYSALTARCRVRRFKRRKAVPNPERFELDQSLGRYAVFLGGADDPGVQRPREHGFVNADGPRISRWP